MKIRFYTLKSSCKIIIIIKKKFIGLLTPIPQKKGKWKIITFTNLRSIIDQIDLRIKKKNPKFEKRKTLQIKSDNRYLGGAVGTD